MTLLDLCESRAPSLADRLARYFQAHPGQWLDGLTLAKVAGAYAWRSRCSDLRKRGMTIENRIERHLKADGTQCVRSLYRYVPSQAE